MASSRIVRPRVERLLESKQEYRDSDKKLLLTIWEEEGLILTAHQKFMFMGCTPAGSITRARRFLRAKYPASAKVEEARFERMEEEQADHSNFFTKRFGRLGK